MNGYRLVIFMGTRINHLRLRRVVVAELEREQALAHEAAKALFVAVGDCPSGVDGYVRGWCAAHLARSDWRVFEADWARYGRAAGPIRNRAMCRAYSDADTAVGLPSSWDRALSKGTWDCLDAADELGLPTRVIGPEVWR
ncbi:hypothetical protein NDR87_18815 [Nocardia sp. CDC159]|uniref:DUF2493 domain-containing protein n=1 Tax=Nocardia pulmonis TaxID=2951408 RepID=A0A9X2IXQ0_9NOCA|nr:MULTISPECIES: hypothetical protein [Nocardia]MCM6776257.1 hypothetical protein [Nocardia pulmonis]MCM6788417.1 hypothetical protein [Nocardia sp. CDC159]